LATPTPIANQPTDANTDKFTPIRDAEVEIDEIKLKEIEEQNAKFEIVPDEWKSIDFENSTYPAESVNGFIKLKNGEFEYSEKNNLGGHFGLFF